MAIELKKIPTINPTATPTPTAATTTTTITTTTLPPPPPPPHYSLNCSSSDYDDCTKFLTNLNVPHAGDIPNPTPIQELHVNFMNSLNAYEGLLNSLDKNLKNMEETLVFNEGVMGYHQEMAITLDGDFESQLAKMVSEKEKEKAWYDWVKPLKHLFVVMCILGFVGIVILEVLSLGYEQIKDYLPIFNIPLIAQPGVFVNTTGNSFLKNRSKNLTRTRSLMVCCELVRSEIEDIRGFQVWLNTMKNLKDDDDIDVETIKKGFTSWRIWVLDTKQALNHKRKEIAKVL